MGHSPRELSPRPEYADMASAQDSADGPATSRRRSRVRAAPVAALAGILGTLIGTAAGGYVTYRATTAATEAQRASDARGAARLLQFELWNDSTNIDTYLGKQTNRLPATYGTSLSPSDQQLIASELSAQQWRKVIGALAEVRLVAGYARRGHLDRRSLRVLQRDARGIRAQIMSGIEGLRALAGGSPFDQVK